jgi:signal transduction histidine kinase
MRADMGMVKEREIEVKLLDLGRQVAEVKEAERLKMAEHLHDEFGQSLLVAKM